MNKTTNSHIWYVLLTSLTIFILSGCGLTLTPMAQPQYIHYTPFIWSTVHVEFDYPSSWVYNEKREAVDIVAISLKDPRFLALPTPVPPIFHPTPNDLGSVVIWVTANKPGQTPKTEVEMLKQSYSKEPHITLLDDYGIMIEGYNASVLEYQNTEPIEGYFAPMFNRRIFFVVKGQMHEIFFSVAEKERGGEFEQGYEYFFNSLKIVQ